MDMSYEARKIQAKPYVWRDPHTIQPRQWLYGRHLIRKFVSATVAPGAVGKSSLALVDAIAMATGRSLVGTRPAGRMRVWYINLEDPQEEIDRRIAAICLHYGIKQEDLDGWLFINSGRDTPVVIAKEDPDGFQVGVPVLNALRHEIEENDIDVLMIDPFVASHGVHENDNMKINLVTQLWSALADVTSSAIELIHHVRKGQSGQGEFTVEDGRGAVAFLAAVRSARVLNTMSKDEAERYDIENRRAYFRSDNGKANLAPPPDESEWYRLVSVDLGNGGGPGLTTGTAFDFNLTVSDHVGVVTSWTVPDPLATLKVDDLRRAQRAVADGGPWRENAQATDWVGVPIGKVLDLDPDNKVERKKISRILRMWMQNNMFEVYEDKDKDRKTRKFVRVKEWAND